MLAGPFVGLMVLAFLVFVSIRLVQRREGAFGLAVWLFLLELVGGVAVVAGENYFGFREYDQLRFAALAGDVGLVWTLPNALILYSRRRKFVSKPETQKPGL
jgi:hypothetical protein